MSNYSDSMFVDDPNTPWYKVLELIPKKSKMLDVGCSSGNFDEIIIKKKQAIIDGIELNKKDAYIAKKKLRKVLNINIESDDLKDLDNDYDVIYFGDVLEHLQFPVKALERTKYLLAKDGVIIFSIPNMAHISVRLMLLGGNFDYGDTGLLDKTHLHYYDENEIRRIFHAAGYKIKHFDWVSRDIPQELIEKKLEKMGLVGDKSFFKLTKSVTAAAYQFVGTAIPVKMLIKENPRPKISPPIDEFEQLLANIRKSYEEDISRIEKDHIQKEKNHEQELIQKINAYENSFSWKLTKPIRKVTKTIRRARP